MKSSFISPVDRRSWLTKHDFSEWMRPDSNPADMHRFGSHTVNSQLSHLFMGSFPRILIYLPRYEPQLPLLRTAGLKYKNKNINIREQHLQRERGY